MKKYLFYCAIVLILFFGSNVLVFLGWGIGVSGSNGVFLIHPGVYFVGVCLLMSFFYLKYIKIEEKLLIFAFVALLFTMFITKNTGTLSNIPNSLLLPVMLSIYLSLFGSTYKIGIRKLIVVFFVVNCCLALVEKMLTVNFFPFTGGSALDNIKEGFRSSALQNHYLNNALFTSIILSFILMSKSITLKLKGGLLLLGFVAFLCFNTRSTIVFWGVWSFVFLLSIFADKKVVFNQKLKFFGFFLILGSLAVTLMFQYGWGDRLFKMGLLDESSSEARFEAFNIFQFYDLQDFLLGVSADKYDFILAKADILILENYWLVFILRYGVIFTVLLTIMYFKLFKRLFIGYSTTQILFTSLPFLIISSTNNSLSGNSMALSVFLLCVYAFNPRKRTLLIKRKLNIMHKQIQDNNFLVQKYHSSI